MVQTFDAPRQIWVLGQSRLSVILLTSFKFSSEIVIWPVGWLKSAAGSEVIVALVVVSIIECFFLRGGVVSIMINPKPGGPGTDLSLTSTLHPADLVQHSQYCAQG